MAKAIRKATQEKAAGFDGETPPSPEAGIDAALSDAPNVSATTPFDDLERALGIGDDDVPVAELLVNVACRKPRQTEFFRVNPAADMTRPAYVFIDKEEIGSEAYLVMPEARPYIAEHLRPVQLVVCVNRQNVVFLWPIALPDPGTNSGRQNRWGSSALEAMKVAQTAWTKMTAGNGSYRVFRAESDTLPEPQWPERTFLSLLTVAFRDRLITGPDHPIVRRLRGQA